MIPLMTYTAGSGATRKRPRPRHVPGEMNATEKAYAQHLDKLKAVGEVIDWSFESMKLKLGKACFYTPDFVVITPDGIEVHEVKGHWEDDARVKIKVAAAKFWWFKFIAIQKDRAGWKVEEF